MTPADQVQIRVDADLGPLRRALRRANTQVARSTDKMSRGFRKVNTSVAKLTAKMKGLKGAAAAVAGVALVKLAQNSVNTSARFEDLQQTLDTVFGSMESGKAAMAFVMEFAKTTPFDVETLTKAMIQLKGAGISPTIDLLNTFGDAASATTNKMQSFEAMVRIATRAVGGGLGLEELEQLVSAGIPVYQILQDEIGVLRQDISEMGQTAEGAAKIMNALQSGLNKRFGGSMERSMENVSTSISNLKINATDLLQAIGDGIGGYGLAWAFGNFADTLSRLITIITPFASLLSSTLAIPLGIIIGVVDAAARSILYLASAAANFVDFASQIVPDKFEKFHGSIAFMRSSMDELQRMMNQTGDLQTEGAPPAPPPEPPDVTATKKVLEGLKQEYNELTLRANGFTDAQITAINAAGFMDNIRAGMYGAPNGIIETDLAQADLIDIILREVASIEALQGKLDAAQTAEDDRTKRKELNAQKTADALAMVESKLAEQQPAYIKLGVEIDKIVEQLPHMDGAMRHAAVNGIELMRDEVQKLAFEFERSINPAFDALVNSAVALGDNITSAFRNMLDGTKVTMADFEDMIKHAVKDVIAQIFKLVVINQVLGAIFPGLNLKTSTLPEIMGLAGGGSAQKGRPYLVGERGPELIVPNQSSTVMNNMSTNKALSGGGGTVVNQTINVQSGVAQTVRAEMISLLPRFKQDTMNAVVDAKRRGGSFGQAFG